MCSADTPLTRVRADEGEVAHAHAAAAVLVDQRDRGQHVVGVRVFLLRGAQVLLVDAVDDLQMPRQHALEQRHRPALERLGQQRVVGVGEGADGDPPGLVPRQPVHVDQDAHQLGDGDARMRVVELDRGAVGQEMDVAVGAQMPAHEVLQRGGDEEIFLPQPQFRPAGVSSLG